MILSRSARPSGILPVGLHGSVAGIRSRQVDAMSRLISNPSFVLALGLCLLAACGQSPDEAKPADTARARAAAAPAVDGDWVMAARSSGVELPLVLRFELPQRPAAGAAFPLNLRFESLEAVEGLSLHLELPDGLASVGPAITLKEPRLAAGGKFEPHLSLKPLRNGMYEVRLRLSMTGDPGKEQSAVYSVPVIVGEP